jgi:hypothetical protein
VVRGLSQSAFGQSVPDMGSILANLYYERQGLVAYYHQIMGFIIGLNKKLAIRRAELFEIHTKQFQIRLDQKERQMLTDADSQIVEMEERKDRLQNHASFVKETLATVNQIHFAIKHRIDIENLKREYL